ncbi:hypothetical protein [uncultured Parolsenella sp.]|uniref:VG15 protein n=1 Tax=uncultured Parolsenella sp. TaxID=2083008 RepID=UPI0027D9768F|nr:hypothetical protein [uncultured Parolsenella sp.]
MALSRQALSDYDATLSRMERAAADYVRRRVDAYMASYPEASVADVRDFAIGVIDDAVGAYGDAASTAAADLYDELAEASPKTLPTAAVDTSDVSGYVDKEVRYQAGKLVDGAPSAFADAVAACASDQVSRRANATMARNARRDHIRYARVPMGGETCTFCAMLASRGFVYRSAKSAGEGTHWHRNCRCKVVPETAGTVEGYDPDEWYGRWREMEAIDADPGISGEAKRAAKVSIATNGSVRLRGGGDPARDYFGSAEESNPDELRELKRYLRSEGVELRPKTHDSVNYGPSPKEGEAGQLNYVPGMSWSAWVHEADHFEFDKEHGFPASVYWWAHPEEWDKAETRAYGKEIKMAEDAGYTELAGKLRENLKADFERRGRRLDD